MKLFIILTILMLATTGCQTMGHILKGMGDGVSRSNDQVVCQSSGTRFNGQYSGTTTCQ